MNPRFHIDKDVAAALKQYLDAHYADPECAVTAAGLGMHRASDGHHLLAAAQAGRILVTHNGKDFIAMQDTWLRWQRAWGIAISHAGVLIIPQEWKPPQSAREIIQFIGLRTSLPNEIYAYKLDVGWVKDLLPR